MKQTQMYVRALVKFTSSRCSHIAVQPDTEILSGNPSGLYTNATIDERYSLNCMRKCHIEI